MSRCIGIVLGVVVLVVASSGTALAHQSPVGCNANRLSVDIARDVSVINSGDTVNYMVSVTNPGSGSGIGCDVTDTDIVFNCPAADGTATGTATVLTTTGNYPADNSADTCWSSGSAPLDGCTHLAGLACVVTVNAGVTQANADVQAGDPSLADKTKGRLHDVTDDSAFSINKAIGVTILEEVTDEFCRTPGFWGTHADADPTKACSQNITWAVLVAAGGTISICGEDITAAATLNDPVDNASSAVEAMCVRVQGEETRQLARQLTAARLNCIVSGESGGACDGISVNDTFDACNAACALGDVIADIGTEEDVSCIDALDCFNNGGQFDLATGVCVTGTCSIGGADCSETVPCTTGECIPLENSCHNNEFSDVEFELPNDSLSPTDPCFEKQGPAGSSDECKAAHKTKCTVVGDTEADCDVQ